jgi:hypothetical protein
MATTTISIAMSDATANRMMSDGFILYALKAVRCSLRSGRPLVWSKTGRFSLTNTVAWDTAMHAYTSMSSVQAGKTVAVGFETAISPGWTLTIGQLTGSGTVAQNGVAGAITIFNDTKSPFTTGLAQASDEAPLPYCAFPQQGALNLLITPLDVVLLMFSTLDLAPGTVIETLNTRPAKALAMSVLAANTGGLLVDATGVSSRSVSYGDLGWDWGGATWARMIQASGSLVPYLIQPEL